VHGYCTANGWPEVAMREIVLSPPKFGFIVATRAALALGIGLLVSRRLNNTKRRNIGTSLVAAGALATIPAVMFIRRGRLA
jgi:adenine/guanine phosphoribosyltransferase-like PRPP-binding protein